MKNKKFWNMASKPHHSNNLLGDIRLLENQELEQASVIENDGYPADEAASFETLLKRHTEASDLFWGYFENGSLIGFICGTRHDGPTLKEEAMKEHLPHGDCVCIHSVCVKKERQREGIALKLLQHYTEHIKDTQTDAVKCLLICKETLIPLYTKANFHLVGRSSVVHGCDAWFEMEMTL